MSAWQFIEAGLSGVYFVASKTPATAWEATRASFYRGGSFANRLEMTNELIARSDLDDANKSEWTSIRKTLKGCSERRNAVAHGLVYWSPYETELLEKQMFVGRNLDDPKHAGSIERYYLGDLERLSGEFEMANDRTDKFYRNLADLHHPFA